MVTKWTTNEGTLQDGHNTDYKCQNPAEWSQHGLQMQTRCRMATKRTTNIETLQKDQTMDYKCRKAVEWSQN